MFFHIVYNIFFPAVFIFFIPGLLIKYIRRPGKKDNYAERFAIFSGEKKSQLESLRGAVWVHAVSVGETNLALTAISAWLEREPERRFILSTTTTTAQEIAVKRAPAGVVTIFCPIDFLPFVKKTFDVLKPSGLVILETELWPNLLHEAKKRGIPTALINARMSDRSVKGYRRFRMFFAPVLRRLDRICVQTETDRERFVSVAPDIAERLEVGGNIKFDQRAPANMKLPDIKGVFAEGASPIIIAASTHPGEELMIARAFKRVKAEFTSAKLIIVPRHAERGEELDKMLTELKITHHRRAGKTPLAEPVDCLLADTTGELLGFMAMSDIVLMGKTFAGNDEGQNIIEPAVLGKPVICGSELKNFRQALEILKSADAVMTADTQEWLEDAMSKLCNDPTLRRDLGGRARRAIEANSGAIAKNIDVLQSLFKKTRENNI